MPRLPDRPFLPLPERPRPPLSDDPDAIDAWRRADIAWASQMRMRQVTVAHDDHLKSFPPVRIVDATGRTFDVLGQENTAGRVLGGLFPFQLVSASLADVEGGEDQFVILPGIIDAAFHPAGAEQTPTYGGTSLASYPVLTANGTETGVYARVELTYDGDYYPLLVGGWTIVGATAKPAETYLARSAAGVITNGIYYRRIGTAQYTEAAGLVLKQDRIGPWHVQMCVGSRELIVNSPWWALSYIQEVSVAE